MSDCAFITEYLETIIKGTKVTNKELSEAINKWKFLFIKTVLRVSNIINKPVEDVISDLLIPIVRLDVTYLHEQYRYLGKIYDLIKDYGGVLHLKTPKFSQIKAKREFFIPEYKVEKVKKASLNSLVYHKLNQTSKLILRNHFTQKNGYIVSGSREGVVKLRGNIFDGSCKRGKIKEVIKMKELSIFEEIGEDYCLGDLLESKDFNQDDYAEVFMMDRSISRGLSSNALLVYNVLRDNPKLPELEIKRHTGLSQRQIKFSKREILLQVDKVLDRKNKIVYSPYAIYDGNYYFLGNERGSDVYLINPGSGNGFYINKTLIDIDSMKYRTPIHLRSCLV